MRIFHPQPELGRQSTFDVEFVDGVATVESLHPERELAFIQHGYRIEPDVEVEEPFHEGLGEPIIDLEKLTKAELRGMLPDSVEVPAKVSHAGLVKLVSELPAEPIPGSLDNGAGTAFSDLSDEQLRETAQIEGLDFDPEATRDEIIGAFITAGTESD